MKKLAFLALAGITLSACRGDEKPTSEPSIVGVWKPSKEIVLNGKDKTVLKTTPADACRTKDTIEFTADKNFNYHSYKLSQNECVDKGIEKGTYTYTPSTKKLSTKYINEEEITTDVVTLTANELQVIAEKSDTNNDGVDDFIVSAFTRVK